MRKTLEEVVRELFEEDKSQLNQWEGDHYLDRSDHWISSALERAWNLNEKLLAIIEQDRQALDLAKDAYRTDSVYGLPTISEQALKALQAHEQLLQELEK